VWEVVDDFVCSGPDNILCVSNEGEYSKHCFHKVKLKKRHIHTESVRKCCRCGCVRK
jgi:hypothetical protein